MGRWARAPSNGLEEGGLTNRLECQRLIDADSAASAQLAGAGTTDGAGVRQEPAIRYHSGSGIAGAPLFLVTLTQRLQFGLRGVRGRPRQVCFRTAAGLATDRQRMALRIARATRCADHGADAGKSVALPGRCRLATLNGPRRRQGPILRRRAGAACGATGQ